MSTLATSKLLRTTTPLVLVLACKPDIAALSAGHGSAGESGTTTTSTGQGGTSTTVPASGGLGGASQTGGATSSVGVAGGGGAGGNLLQGGSSGTGVAGTTGICEIKPFEMTAQPLLKYDFDTGSGDVAQDSSTHGLNGTLVGVPVWSSGRLAGGLTFNAANQFVELPPDVLKSLESVTVAAWVKLSANPSGATLFDFGSSGTNHFYLRTNSGNATNPGLSYGAQVGGGTALEALTAYSLPVTVWKHVALAVGEGIATLYVDGLPINSKPFNFTPSSLGATAGNWLARTHSNGSNLWGTIDDVRIYDRALNREEIESIAVPGSDYMHFRFDEPCGTDSFDRSEKGLVAKLPAGGTWTGGHVGGALQLNGYSQYVELPAGFLQSCNDLSVAMWVQRASSTGWERLFSVGSGLGSVMTLTPATPLRYMRFSARLNGDLDRDSSAQQLLTSSSASLSPQSGIWSHVAVVIQSGTGRLYFDGQEAASGSITVTPSALGSTTINELGKPLYVGEPYLAATIDDLRISCRAFSPAEIKILAMVDP